MTTPPPDTRPYRRASAATGDEIRTHTATHTQTWRQIGWHGQSGAFYALGEQPTRHEPGSVAGLWLLADTEPRTLPGTIAAPGHYVDGDSRPPAELLRAAAQHAPRVLPPAIATEAERHAAHGWGNDQREVTDEYTPIARAILSTPATAAQNEAALAHERATVDRVRALATDMRTWASPHGLADHYAQQIETALTPPTSTNSTSSPLPARYPDTRRHARVRARDTGAATGTDANVVTCPCCESRIVLDDETTTTGEESPAAAERDAAYRERAELLAWLAALHPADAVITEAHDVDEPGWLLLYLYAGGRQLSWHIAPRDAELFRGVPRVPASDARAAWDGHSTSEKYARIRQHTRTLHTHIPEAEASVRAAELRAELGVPPEGEAPARTAGAIDGARVRMHFHDEAAIPPEAIARATEARRQREGGR